MNDSQRLEHGNEGPDASSIRHPAKEGPYWRRAHLDWKFRIALALMFIAIFIFVMSDNLYFLPIGPAR
jgi:hypothetical protein